MDNKRIPFRSSLSRRQFLKIVAIGGTALAGNLMLGDMLKHNEVPVIRESQLLMNTVVSLTLIDDDPANAREACDACLQAMRRYVDVFNRFDPHSQVSKLNNEGKLKRPDPLLVDLLHQADLLGKLSDGAFDISIKPLLDVYLLAQKDHGRLPDSRDVRSALRLVDYRKIFYDNDEVGFSLPGMNITFDGIAKGLVVDAGVAALRMTGFDNVIVEAAGDLMASGERDVQVPWKIGIRPPREGMDGQLPILNIKNRAVATSGDYLQAFTDDYSMNHILDPRMGVSSTELTSVTVVAPSAGLADGLATAIMVLGTRNGLELLNSFPGCDAYVIEKNLQPAYSRGMSQYFFDHGLDV